MDSVTRNKATETVKYILDRRGDLRQRPKVLQKLPPADTESFLGKLGAVEQPLGTTVQEQVRASELSSPLLLIMSNASLVSDDLPKLLRLGSFWQIRSLDGCLGGSLGMILPVAILLDELCCPLWTILLTT